MSALEGIADKLAEAVHVADVPEADICELRRAANFLSSHALRPSVFEPEAGYR
jgi:hypothetical protein